MSLIHLLKQHMLGVFPCCAMTMKKINEELDGGCLTLRLMELKRPRVQSICPAWSFSHINPGYSDKDSCQWTEK